MEGENGREKSIYFIISKIDKFFKRKKGKYLLYNIVDIVNNNVFFYNKYFCKFFENFSTVF